MAFGTGWYYAPYHYDDVYWPYAYTYGAGTWYNEHTARTGGARSPTAPMAGSVVGPPTIRRPAPTRVARRRTVSTSPARGPRPPTPEPGPPRGPPRAAMSMAGGGPPRWCGATTRWTSSHGATRTSPSKPDVSSARRRATAVGRHIALFPPPPDVNVSKPRVSPSDTPDARLGDPTPGGPLREMSAERGRRPRGVPSRRGISTGPGSRGLLCPWTTSPLRLAVRA